MFHDLRSGFADREPPCPHLSWPKTPWCGPGCPRSKDARSSRCMGCCCDFSMWRGEGFRIAGSVRLPAARAPRSAGGTPAC